MLWLWRRLAATAPIQPLAWELSYAAGTAQEMAKKTKKKKKKKEPLKSNGRGYNSLVFHYFFNVFITADLQCSVNVCGTAK